jgi:polyisoprenoid-binding protein YceI
MSVIELLASGRAAGQWVLDPEQSSVTFAVKHFWGLVTVRGRFDRVSGSGNVSETGAISASVTVDAGSLDTKNRRRDDHLRSSDFFATDAHPSVVITTTRVDAPRDREPWVMAADLSAAGRTVPVDVELTLDEATEATAHVRARLVTDRTQFEMTWSPLGMASSTAVVDADLRFVRDARDPQH